MAARLRLKAISLFIAGGLAATPAFAGPSLVFDAATGEVISQDRAGEPWYPASLTKLMTAYVVFEKLKRGEMQLDQKLTVSQLASSQPASKVGMRPGSTITVDLALQMLLIYSANDMAYVLAEGASGSYTEFAKLMNAEAKRLGMTATHYANPNGLFDPRQVTSARDIGVLAAAILRDYPEHTHLFSQAAVTLGKRQLRNRNSLLRQMKTADGMKTGFVCNSGYNLTASASENGRKLIAIVLGAPGGKARADLAEMMLTAGFAKPPQPQQIRIGQIANMELGAVVPADMTQTVCKGKPTAIAKASGLTGWGVSFGSYDKPETADMALRGRLLGVRDMVTNSTSGVVRVPGANGFNAMVWNLDQASSLSVCSAFRNQPNGYCDVMTPESFAAIAALARATEERIQPAASQGDEDPPEKKPQKKKAAKKKKN